LEWLRGLHDHNHMIAHFEERFQLSTKTGRIFNHLTEVSRRRSLGSHPSLIQRLHDIIRERSLFQIRQVPFQLLQAADANDHAIVTAFDPSLQFGVVNAPSQRDLEQGQIMLLRSLFSNLECLEGSVFEVAVTVHASDAICFRAETAFVRLDIFGFDLAGEETAG
jgi:hypothetical protein